MENQKFLPVAEADRKIRTMSLKPDTINNHPRHPRILIRAANWVGDAIMTTPVIRAIKKNYPHSHVTLLSKPWVAPVFFNNPYIDEIMVYDDKNRHTKGMGTLRLAKDLRQKKFDIAVLMQNAFEAGLITFFAGIPIRLGYNTDGRGLLLHPGVPMNPVMKKGHLIDYYRGILKGAGLEDDGRKLDLFITTDTMNQARQILDSNNVDFKKPVIGINPGATGGTAKRWFPRRFARLAKRLSNRYKVKIIIFGGPDDTSLGEFIKKESDNACINMAGHSSLEQAFALISLCSLFITNDSGLMHAAAALDINQIAIIGSTDHIATSPANLNSFIIKASVSCSPCLKPECRFGHHKCMDLISVDRVEAIAVKILDRMEHKIFYP